MRKLTDFCPEETVEQLRCPERGFYSIVRFLASEEAPAPEVIPRCRDDTLLLAEINLRNFASCGLPPRVLEGIRGLFRALRATGCGLIPRFLYDWDGKNMTSEPKRLETILHHMSQVGPILRENAEGIFLTQGLFVGNWGEMHGSRYLERDQLRRLYECFSDAAAGLVRLSVRTPGLWRTVTRAAPDEEPDLAGAPPEGAPGLFNDGMLGSESDCGTYGGIPPERERELAFQERLCLFVPNGGEVVGSGPWSDAAPAMDTLRRMHVSYLNRDYDENTLAKWKNAEIREKGVWDGKNCFDYVQAHLGYRFVIRSAELRMRPLAGLLSAGIAVENVGFAPIYHAAEAQLVLCTPRGERAEVMRGEALQRAFGQRQCLFTAAVPLPSEKGQYEIRFRLRSLKYGVTIPTANRGGDALGCPIGRLIVK